MDIFAPSKLRQALMSCLVACAFGCAGRLSGFAQVADSSQTPEAAQKPSVTISRELVVPAKRIPRELALTTAALEGVVREQSVGASARPIAGAQIWLRDIQTNEQRTTVCSGDGVFRVVPLAPGSYELRIDAAGYSSFVVPVESLSASEVLTLEIVLVPDASVGTPSRLPRQPELGRLLLSEMPAVSGGYREFRHRLDSDPNYILEFAPDVLPPTGDVFHTMSNRWGIPQPVYRRYVRPGEYVYVKPHWYDPFNHNRLKGDEPIWPAVLGQQVFLNFTGSAETFLEGRHVPTPSGVSTAQPGSADFFGKGDQLLVDQTFRFTFDLFHGDTSFKPVDWRVRVTPEISLNYLDVQELGVVSPDVRRGTTRYDNHLGLSEAFAEVRLHDLSPNYDFVSVRAGIQEFNGDFRGFLFVDEEPGLRIFGDLHNNRIEYNAAYFSFLEKNTNSGLNTFEGRGQQVVLANAYVQDFLFPGYTAEFVGAWNKDDPSIHFNDNGFLVRSEPIGNVVNQGTGPIPHGIRIGYFGWLGSGHIERLNVTHAFYEAAGKDTFNPIAGRSVTVNAQMAAVELSVDRDWIRYRASMLYASGDGNPRNGCANGFDSIVDLPNFAGGMFSFWDREALRLTGTGVALTQDGSLLPNMRASNEEG
jgi:hypothetical protein